MDSNSIIYQKAESRLEDYLAAHGMRKTPERYEILRAACAMTGLFSIDELAQRMQDEATFQVSRVTLFNSLETFVDARLVIKHSLKRAALYECNIENKPRVYLVCDKCDTVKSMEKSDVMNYLRTLRSRSFVVRQPVLYLHGLCKKCDIQQRKQMKKENK